MKITNMSLKYIAYSFLFIVSTLLVSCEYSGSTSSNDEWMVAYAISGSAKSVSVTWETPDGTEQHNYTLPVTPIYMFKRGHFAYVSAQNNGESGNIIIEILVNGDNVIKTVKSSGPYSIATASWTVGSGNIAPFGKR